MRRSLFILAAAAAAAFAAAPAASAQKADDDPDAFLRQALGELEEFSSTAQREQTAFRDSVMSQFKAWVDAPWKASRLSTPVKPPHDDTPPVPPVIRPVEPAPAPPTPIRPVVVAPRPKPEPAPAPAPIIPLPEPAPLPAPSTAFAYTLYGTPMEVQAAPTLRFSLGRTTDHRRISRAVASLVDSPAFDTLVASFSALRARYDLSDWAMLKAYEAFAKAFLPGDANAQAVMTTALLVTSGYKALMGSLADGTVIPLFGSDFTIYRRPYWTVKGTKYYPLPPMEVATLSLTQESPYALRAISPQVTGHEKWAMRRASQPHRIVGCTHRSHHSACPQPAVDVSLRGNLNRLDFCTDAPKFSPSDNSMRAWDGYALADLSDDIKEQLYPALLQALQGLTPLEQVNTLMRFVEDIPYEYDDKVWGGDRAFFAEETLHYPSRDCEDGAILLVRLVRDLTSLPIGLLYYPGHMATAVDFGADAPANGAYIDYQGRRYTVCDPTIYYGAPGADLGRQVDPSKAVFLAPQ